MAYGQGQRSQHSFPQLSKSRARKKKTNRDQSRSSSSWESAMDSRITSVFNDDLKVETYGTYIPKPLRNLQEECLYTNDSGEDGFVYILHVYIYCIFK